jgi:hypothetical protein
LARRLAEAQPSSFARDIEALALAG